MIYRLLLLSFLPALSAAEPLTLAQCIDEALERHASVRLGEQAVARAAADLQAARAPYLPALGATLFNFRHLRTGSSVRIQENPTGEVDPRTGRRLFVEQKTLIPGIDRNTYSLNASLSYTLYDGGQRAGQLRASRRALAQSEADLHSRAAAVVFAVKRGYYEVLEARELVEVQRESLALSERRLQAARARLEVGAATRADVLRLQVALENAQADLIDAEQGLVLARARLNHAMGRQVASPLQVAPLGDDELEVAIPASLEEVLQAALDENLELQRRRRAEEAAQYALQAARDAWMPRLVGTTPYSRNNEVFDRVFGEIDRNYSFNAGVSLNYDLFDGGVRRAREARARSNVETARLERQQQERDVALAVQTAYLELVRLQKILRSSERALQLAREDLRLAEERYHVGKGRLLEVLDAQLNLTSARSRRVRTRYDLKAAEAELEQLLGGGD